jgi:dCMP deaminase
MTSHPIPDHDRYFMGIAMAVRERANCRGRRVGAVIVKDNRIVSTGYNGTPAGMTNCLDGGCARCAQASKTSGAGYDVCICVHAEQNAVLAAARFGISIDGAGVYSTLRPCFDCTKQMLQAGIRSVCFLHDWAHPDPVWQTEYAGIQSRFERIQRVVMNDPREAWAQGRTADAAGLFG